MGLAIIDNVLIFVINNSNELFYYIAVNKAEPTRRVLHWPKFENYTMYDFRKYVTPTRLVCSPIDNVIKCI
jgi:hypothetical protein